MLIVLTQMAIADYRNQFIRHLVDVMNDRDMQFKIVVGEEYFEESTKTSKLVLSLDETTVIKNSFFFKRKLAFQHLPWRTVLKADILICELNPRILSVWLVLCLRKILNKKTVFWGHVWARKGKESKTEKIRNLMRKRGRPPISPRFRSLKRNFPHARVRTILSEGVCFTNSV